MAARRRHRIWFAAIVGVLLLCAVPGRAVGPRLAGRWEGAIEHDGKVWRVALDVGDGASPVASVDLLDYGVFGIPFAMTTADGRVRFERQQPGGAPVVFEAAIGDGALDGVFTGLGIRDSFSLVRVASRSPEIREVAVTFSNGDATLAGTLLAPPGAGPHPAVVCVHGSNPDSRATAGYRSEGVFFARLGVAALIYDKRGVGDSTGDYRTASMEDLAGDALAGLAAIRTRRDIDPKRVGITGESQAGWIAPLAASLSPDVAFVVVLSASGINPMEQTIFHTSNVLRDAGFSEDVVRRAARLRRRLYERARTGAFDKTFLADLEAASREPWFATSALPFPVESTLSDGVRRFLLFEPAPVWERVKVPVLAIWGENDINLPAETSKIVIGRSLEKGGNRAYSLQMFVDADHSLSVVRDPKAAWDFPREAPGVHDFVARWVHQRVLGR